MATGGAIPGEEDDPNMCPVCLETFRQPKFLPCHHTFCSPCIQDLADRRPGASFPCPSCRSDTTLPPGGVTALQTNFYIHTSAQRPGPAPTPGPTPAGQNMCTTHPEERLRFHCVPCDEPICRDCKLTRHEQHETDDLTPATSRKKKDLHTDQQRLRRAVADVTERVTSLEEERQSLDRKRAAVEKNIRGRYETVVAAAKSKLADELLSLQSVHADLDQDVAHALQEQEGNKAQLSSLLQQLDNAITSGTASDVFTVAKEVKTGRGSQRAVDALTSREERPTRRPVLHVNVSADVMIQASRDYVGNVSTMEMEEKKPEMRVTERFQCAQDPDVEVFSLCHYRADPHRVLVSYERCGLKKDAPYKEFTEAGECVYTGNDDREGKASFKFSAEGEYLALPPQPGLLKTYCKSPAAAHLSLANNLSGQADVKRVTVAGKDPTKVTTVKPEFAIQVGPHRAFDVDDKELYFAVVEEAKASTHWRNVRLYKRSVKAAVSEYSPPIQPYQPSDVCFYKLGKETVLLITDEHNDVIHVVSVRGGRMCFQRYLCGGCPSIIQPTAITVDVYDRLWLACRGGAILTLEPTPIIDRTLKPIA